jgi:hypothetical protein
MISESCLTNLSRQETALSQKTLDRLAESTFDECAARRAARIKNQL